MTGTVPVNVVDMKLFFSDPYPTYQEIQDPDPTLNFFVLTVKFKIFSNQWRINRFYAILVTKNWSSQDPDPKLIITVRIRLWILQIISDPNGSTTLHKTYMNAG